MHLLAVYQPPTSLQVPCHVYICRNYGVIARNAGVLGRICVGWSQHPQNRALISIHALKYMLTRQ